MELFGGDCFIEIETDDGKLHRFDKVNEETGRRLCVDFDCLKTQHSHPNKSNVKIYNLSETSRNMISRNGKKIRFYAGYGAGIKMIAVGDIVIALSRKIPPEWVTEITFGDGQFNYDNAQTSIALSEGTEVKDIVSIIARDLGVVVSTVSDAVKGLTNGSLTLDGLSKDQLSQVADDYGLSWSIQDEELVVVNEGKPVNNEAIVMNAGTGLIEAIVGKASNKIKAQLQPDIRPNKLIKIEAIGWSVESAEVAIVHRGKKDFNGLYLCKNVKFLGNNYGGQFDVEVEVIPYV